MLKRGLLCLATLVAFGASSAYAANSTVTVTRAGSGSGTVTAGSGAINCGATCDDIYADGTMLTLTAVPATGHQFTGWLGPCSGVGLQCTFLVAGDAAVAATFAATPVGTPWLDIDGSGNGCDALTDGLLAARHLLGVAGTGLVGGAIGPGAARTSDVQVGAFLGDVHPAFDVDGNGVVEASSDGVLILRRLFGNSGSALAGNVLGNGATRTVAEDIASYVDGLCAPPQAFLLTVAKIGSGTGAVTANGGIDCGAACSASYSHNTGVLLSAAASIGSTFTGWSGGGCTGTNPCSVTMDAAKSVTAAFSLNQYALTISKAGAGTGTVTSSPPGISCGATCTAQYDYGTQVALVATASVGSTFIGWSGAGCSGSGACVVTMTAAANVTASFTANQANIAFVSTQQPSGNMGGLAGADAICQTDATVANLTGTYRAYLSSATASAISRLGTARGWVRVDGKPVADTISDFVNGDLLYPLRISSQGVDVGHEAIKTASTLGGVFSTLGGAGDCSGYTSTLGSVVHGNADGQGALATITGTLSCATPTRLYCLGIDRIAVVQVTPVPARRLAFTTSANWSPGSGIASADALCQSEATGSSLTGTYKALLATSSVAAGSRFNTAGLPWGRVDGVLLAADPTTMFTATLWDASPGVGADGVSYGNTGIWSGNASLSTVGSLATTCQDWTNAAPVVTAVGGRAGYSHVPSLVGFDTADSCGSTILRLVCLQQ